MRESTRQLVAIMIAVMSGVSFFSPDAKAGWAVATTVGPTAVTVASVHATFNDGKTGMREFMAQAAPEVQAFQDDGYISPLLAEAFKLIQAQYPDRVLNHDELARMVIHEANAADD